MAAVGQEVEQSIRSLLHVADPFAQVAEVALLEHHRVVL